MRLEKTVIRVITREIRRLELVPEEVSRDLDIPVDELTRENYVTWIQGYEYTMDDSISVRIEEEEFHILEMLGEGDRSDQVSSAELAG